MRIWQKGRHTDINGHAAFNTAFNLTLYGAVFSLDFGNLFPYFDADGLFAGEKNTTLLFPFFHENLEGITYFDFRLLPFSAEFGERDVAFCFIAYINENMIVNYADDRTHDDISDFTDGTVFFHLKEISKAHLLSGFLVCFSFVFFC